MIGAYELTRKPTNHNAVIWGNGMSRWKNPYLSFGSLVLKHDEMLKLWHFKIRFSVFTREQRSAAESTSDFVVVFLLLVQ